MGGKKSSSIEKIPKRCWTLEYSGELEFSSPFMEPWTLDARGVLKMKPNLLLGEVPLILLRTV